MPTDSAFDGTERFKVQRKLGKGGMGIVYEAFDTELKVRVALKTLVDQTPKSLLRLKREFRSLAEISHPNLVPLYELVADGDDWFFTMELVEDCKNFVQSLWDTREESEFADAETQLLTETKEGSFSGSIAGPTPTSITSAANLDYERCREAFIQLADGIEYLHGQGKLHRDIKPSNVMLDSTGKVHILDFGLVTEVAVQTFVSPDTDLSDFSTDYTTSVAGTIGFMAPEQRAGEPLSAACDWYSVGILLYITLTGRHPYTGKSLKASGNRRALRKGEINFEPKYYFDSVPEDLNELCMRLLSKDPAKRPNGQQILSILQHEPEPRDSLPSSLSDVSFVGRESLLGQLRLAHDVMMRGEAAVVSVQGHSGAGKSSLVRHFIDQSVSAEPHTVVVSGRCYEQESVPFKALDSLVDALTRHLLRIPISEAAALMPRHVAALSRLFPVLMQVEPIRNAQSFRVDNDDPQKLRRMAFAALRELLSRIGDRDPLIIYVDDLQWGDTDSAVFLADLLKPPDPPPCMLIVSYRSEYIDKCECLQALHTGLDEAEHDIARYAMSVGPLNDDDARDLATALLGKSDLQPPKGVIEDIVRESSGNPMFVIELARRVIERDSDDLSAEPIDIDQAIWERVERLESAENTLLKTIAVAGRPITFRAVTRAAGQQTLDPNIVVKLRNDGLIRCTGPRMSDDVQAFHDRVRESILQRMPEQDLQNCHRALGEALEAVEGTDPETLAIHFHGAGQSEKAGRFYEQAADSALHALAFAHAADLYGLALDLLDLDEDRASALKMKRAESLANAGRGSEAADLYVDAATHAEGSEEIELLKQAAYQYCISGHVDEGRDSFRRVLKRFGYGFPGTPLQAVLKTLWMRGRLRIRGFRVKPVQTVSEDVVQRIDVIRAVGTGIAVIDPLCGWGFQTHATLLSMRAGDPYRSALCLAWDAASHSCSGKPARKWVDRLLCAADALAVKADHPRPIGMVRLAYGIADFMEGENEPCYTLAEEAETIFSEHCSGANWEMNTAKIFKTWGYLYAGQLALLRENYQELMTDTRERGDRYLMATAGTQIGTIALLMNDQPGFAQQQLDEILAQWTRVGFNVQHHNGVFGQIYLHLYRGDPIKAYEIVESTLPTYRKAMLFLCQHIRVDWHGMAGRCAIAAAQASKDPTGYQKKARYHIKKLRKEKLPWGDGLAAMIESGLELQQGERDKGIEQLRATAQRFREAKLLQLLYSTERKLGGLIGGEEGAQTVKAADAWFRQEGIRDAEKFAHIYCPITP